jgi:hypothetical protein
VVVVSNVGVGEAEGKKSKTRGKGEKEVKSEKFSKGIYNAD